MGTPSPSRRPLTGRLVGGLLALGLAVSVGGWLSAELAAQKSKDEVEEEKPGKPTKHIDVDDDPAPAKPRKKLQMPSEPEVQTNLTEAFKNAKTDELRALFRGLKYPHDRITVRTLNDGQRTDYVKPLAQYYPDTPPIFKRGVRCQTYDEEWRSGSVLEYRSALRVQPYEEAAIEDVDQFLKKDPARLRLTRVEMLAAAETVLAAADRFHKSALDSGEREKSNAWQEVGRHLHERLLDVQREGLRERLKGITSDGTDKSWDDVCVYAGALAKTYKDPAELAAIAKLLVDLIDKDVPARANEKQLGTARDRFLQLEKIFGAEAVAKGGQQLARRLLDEATAKGMAAGAARLRVQIAAAVSPGLSDDVAREMANLDSSNPVLTVGVPQLPAHMIPGWSATDADRWAIELMYEGLVKLRVQPGVGERYEPALAGGAPRLVPLGREFRLARGAAWSDGTPVTVTDVKETLATLRREGRDGWPGYCPLRNRMTDDPEAGGDSSVLRLRLRQGYLDPLSLMTFKVMPQRLLKQADPAGATPLGSGPFRLKEQDKESPDRVEFVANSRYGTREGKFGLPRVREIQFVRLGDDPDAAVKALKAGTVDLVLGLPAPKVKEAKAVPGVTVVGPLPNRRVYFLAVNHRDPRLHNNVFLRRALALAIDRQAILNKFFREEPDSKTHHALNGPFPAGSWPCEPKQVRADLHNSEDAKAQAHKAVEQAGGPIKLKVKYPAGDSAAHAALVQLCADVNQELKLDEKTYVELELVEPGVEPYKLREDVERTHEYELAYYHYDHPSEAYWVAPLFDLGATEINGSNYLGYIDGELQAQLEEAKNQRDFDKVQTAMRLAHRMLDQKMPLIPLWQLDTFLAHRRGVDLKDAHVDPLLIFNEVEKWKLEGKGN